MNSPTTNKQGRSQKFVFGGYKSFWGWIKLLNSRSDVILPHKKFTWADFGGIYPDIPPPCRYAPANKIEYLKMNVVWLLKDDLVGRLASVTSQLGDVETDRNQLSARLEQLQKVIQDVEQGRLTAVSLTYWLISKPFSVEWTETIPLEFFTDRNVFSLKTNYDDSFSDWDESFHGVYHDGHSNQKDSEKLTAYF